MTRVHNPLRLFEGDHQPHEPFWRVRDAADSDSGEPEIDFYGYISEYSWFDDDITPKLFKEALYGSGKGGPVTVRMNSGGGEVFAASVIKSLLVEYPGRVTVRIDGLAASAATIVAMGGDVIKMQDSAYMMIHDPSTLAFGTIDELKRALDLLKVIKEGIIDGYSSRTRLAPEKLARMMTDETWMTAQDALEMGFIDEVISGPGAYTMPAIANALQMYRNVPDAVLQAFQPLNVPAEPVSSEPDWTEDMEREAQSLRERVVTILRKENENA